MATGWGGAWDVVLVAAASASMVEACSPGGRVETCAYCGRTGSSDGEEGLRLFELGQPRPCHNGRSATQRPIVRQLNLKIDTV